jgi:hypothetical protein
VSGIVVVCTATQPRHGRRLGAAPLSEAGQFPGCCEEKRSESSAAKMQRGSVLSREPRDVCAAFARRDHARVERVLRQGTPGTETAAHLQVTVSYPS